jgi:hypothetical protein
MKAFSKENVDLDKINRQISFESKVNTDLRYGRKAKQISMSDFI